MQASWIKVIVFFFSGRHVFGTPGICTMKSYDSIHSLNSECLKIFPSV